MSNGFQPKESSTALWKGLSSMEYTTPEPAQLSYKDKFDMNKARATLKVMEH